MQTITTTQNWNPILRSRRCWGYSIELPYVDCEGPASPNYDIDCSCMLQEQFFFPVQQDDVWDLQSFLIDEINSPENVVAGFRDGVGNWLYELQIVQCGGGVLGGNIDQYASEWIVGYTGDKFMQLARVDFSLFWAQLEEVFCIRFEVFDAAQESIGFVYFPPMRKDPACRETITMESTHTSYDCMGRYYGECEAWYGSDLITFNNWRRIKGNVEVSSFPITTDLTDSGAVIGKTIEKYGRLRTHGLPEYVVNEMAAIFAGEDVTVGGAVWDVLPTLEKNNEDSPLWYIDGTMERIECEYGQDCD